MTISLTSAHEIANRAGATSGLAEISGNQIYYEVAGEGLPIVFLHDGIAHSIGFEAQFATFSRAYTVIGYDRPGYGNSKPPTLPYSDVTTLKGVLDFLGLETAILIGGSGGGMIALNFAVMHPHCVEALVLVGAGVSGFAFTDHMRYRGWRNDKWGDSIPEFIEFWVNDPWLIAEENQPARARLHKILTASPQNLTNFPVERVDDIQALPRLSEIQVPTLILVGESDIADNHAHSGVIQVGIRDSERQVVTQAGHLVYLEQPDKFNQLVIEFLNRRLNKPPA